MGLKGSTGVKICFRYSKLYPGVVMARAMYVSTESIPQLTFQRTPVHHLYQFTAGESFTYSGPLNHTAKPF